jgi:hypothetical protein
MTKYIIVFLIIVGLIILLRKQNENYVTFYSPFKSMYNQRYCSDCKSKSILTCGDCFNCGICVKNNVSTCESGDITGPDSMSCDQWIYNTNEVAYNYYVPYYYDYYYPRRRSHYRTRKWSPRISENKRIRRTRMEVPKTSSVRRTTRTSGTDVFGRGKKY